MRGRNSNLSEDANVDLTPMLDVVFILLIFFIITSTFIQEDAIAMEGPPPVCNCPTPDTPAIIIFVDASNFIRMGGALTDISAVRSNIERRRAESPAAAVMIQADPEAHTGVLIKLRDIVYDAKVERVNIVRSVQG